MAEREIKTVLSLSGEQTYQQRMKDITADQRKLNDELRKSSTEFESTGDAQKYAEDRVKVLNQQVAQQKTRLDEANSGLARAKELYGENSTQVQRYERDVSSAEQYLMKYETQLSKANEELNFQKSLLPQTAEAIKDLDKQQESLNREMKLAESQYKLTGDQTEYSKEKVRVLGQQVDVQNRKLTESKQALSEANRLYGEGDDRIDEYKKAVMEAEIELVDLQATLQDANAELKQQSSRLIQTGKDWQSSGQKIQAVGDKLQRSGVVLSAAITAPIVAGAVVATKAAIDYEAAFAGVIKTVDGTAEELDAIRDGIIEMSKRMPSAATEIAGVAEAAGQLGIQTDAVLGFTEVIIGMGSATNLAGEEGAAAMAQFANVTKMSQKDFDRLGSSIVQLGNNGASTEKDIMSMAMRVGAAGSQVGMTVPQILGLSATLTNVGIEAEAGGSALSKLLVDMQVASETGVTANKVLAETGYSLRDLQMMMSHSGKEFGALAESMGLTRAELTGMVNSVADLEAFSEVTGMTGEAFAQAFGEDATGALQLFIQGLAGAEEKGTSAIAVLDGMGITEVRMRDAILKMVSTADMMTDTIDMSNEAWEENIALQVEVAAAQDTTEAKISMAKNALMATAMELADSFLPHITTAAEKVGELAERFGDLDDSTQQTILIGLAVAAGLGPAITAIGTVTKTYGQAKEAAGKFAEFIGNKKPVQEMSTALGAGGKTIGLSGALAAVALVAVSWKVGEILYESIKPGTAAVRDFITESDKLRTSFEKSAGDVETSAALAKGYADRLSELANQTKRTAEEQVEMESLVSRLNGLYPELNLLIDDQTGALEGSTKEIYNQIEAYKERMLLEIYEERYKGVLSEQVQLKQDLTAEEERLRDAQQKTTGTFNESGNVFKAVFGAISDGALETQENIEIYNEKIAENERELAELESTMSTTRETLDSYGNTTNDTTGDIDTNTGALNTNTDAIETNAEAEAEAAAAEKAALEEKLAAEERALEVRKNLKNMEIDVTEDHFDQMQAIYDEYEEDIKEYWAAYEKQYNTYLTQMGGLGDKNIEQQTLTAAEIKKNLEQQIKDFQLWREEIAELAGKVPNDVMDALKEMGPGSTNLIAELNSMTSTELDSWVDVWQTKSKLAADTAEEELSWMSGAAAMEAIRTAGAMDKELEPMANYVALRVVDAILAFTDAEGAFSSAGYSLGKSGVKGFDTEFMNLPWKTRQALNQVTSEAKKMSIANVMRLAGADGVQGFINGMNSKKALVAATIGSIAKSVPDKTKSVLQIQSPSKVMVEAGEYTGEGLVVGLESMVGDVEKASDKLAAASVFDANSAALNALSVQARSVNSQAGQYRTAQASSTSSVKNEYVTVNVTASPGMSENESRRIGQMVYQGWQREKASKGG